MRIVSALSSILPPPNFLSMNCVGVDVSDNSLKYIGFKPNTHSGKDKVLRLWGDINIPNGVVQRGEVKDVDQLSTIFKEFRDRTNSEFVRLSLPEEKAYLFETQVRDNVPFKEIRNLMEFRLEENVPIPSRDVLFDFKILPQEKDGQNIQIAVAAYSRETIELYYEACQRSGLFPVSFEIEAQAMARSMLPSYMEEAVMIVDFGKTRTGIGIVYKNTLLYTSTIDVGGDQLSGGLRKMLGSELAESEITKIKNVQGLLLGSNSSDVRDAFLSTVSVIKDEIATRMQYWHLRNNDGDIRQIKSIIMSGGSVNLRGLPEYLTESLGLPCVRGNVWGNAFSLDKKVPPVDRRHSYGYATAIGLALRSNV